MSEPDDEERAARAIRCRIVDQWTTCRRHADPAARDKERRAFHDRWRPFMEGGWERLCVSDPSGVENARLRVLERLPTHPKTVRVAELAARLVDLEVATDDERLFAALLQMERHGQILLSAGWACRPPPRVPRRGTAIEDMFLLLGYGPAREPYDGCG